MAQNPVIPASPSEETYAVDVDQGDVFTSNDPIALFEEWLSLARKTEPNDPNTMALATVDANGMPDVRMVLLKDVDVGGLTFFTNTESAKGRQLTENPSAALCFHWKTIRRQVRFRGPVEQVTPEEADAYFATRSRSARIGAWASDQSRPMDARKVLAENIEAEEEKFRESDVPRPPHWSGFCVKPVQIEFWVNRPFRLHDRLIFEQDGDASWRTSYLFP